MRKMVFILVVGVLFFVFCKKDWMCECKIIYVDGIIISIICIIMDYVFDV